MALRRRSSKGSGLRLPKSNSMFTVREGKSALPRILNGRENAARQGVIARYQAMATWVPGGKRRQASKGS